MEDRYLCSVATNVGKFLIEHQAFNTKSAEMATKVKPYRAWLENITFQMNTMKKSEQNIKLGGHIAMLKLASSRTARVCASNTMQVFGGAGYLEVVKASSRRI